MSQALTGTLTARDRARIRWGKRLAAKVAEVLRQHPDADPDIVRLTLINLELPPAERLQRSLRRGRGFAAFRR